MKCSVSKREHGIKLAIKAIAFVLISLAFLIAATGCSKARYVPPAPTPDVAEPTPGIPSDPVSPVDEDIDTGTDPVDEDEEATDITIYKTCEAEGITTFDLTEAFSGMTDNWFLALQIKNKKYCFRQNDSDFVYMGNPSSNNECDLHDLEGYTADPISMSIELVETEELIALEIENSVCAGHSVKVRLFSY
jgi:hypothetical protein